ncbi:MAG: GAF domain-containing protein [Deltaproteobacteria bacterium]|nr:GAF domain-containing protein [Deltaproteobacteria bacterium]
MFRFSILKKFILAFLLLSIVPLAVLGAYTWHYTWKIGQSAIASSTMQLEKRALESIELQAINLANQVSQLLTSCEADLFTLRMLPRNAETYRQFSLNHHRTIWTREIINNNISDRHHDIPVYREMAFIDAMGHERIRIVDKRIIDASGLRDVSRPGNTEYRNERYFEETRKLRKGQIYVSHVTGWYVTQEEQLQGADSVETAIGGKSFLGVVRFAVPCIGENGAFQGMVLLSLDHRHLMELTLHVLPTEERFVVFPSYSSGNYAFMFDDEGWMISHPKFWDIRGMLPDGDEFSPTAPDYTLENVVAGNVPFNLDHVDFINPNYPLIAREVRAGRSGVTNTFNVGGIPRVMAYAPILYKNGPYGRFGVFGGITIGVQTDKFKEPALLTGAKIDEIVSRTKQNSLIIISITAFAAILLAFILSRKLTRPILLLSDKAREIAAGQLSDDITVSTGDELELLAHNFVRMVVEITDHRKSLEHSLSELAESKKFVEQYTLELEKQVRILKSVHSLSHYLGNEFDRELVLQRVLRTCVTGLGFDRSILYLYDPQTNRLICHQTFGFSSEHEKRAKNASYDIDLHDCVPTRAFRSGETIFVHDIHTDRSATPLDIKISEIGEFDFFVFTPIRSGERMIGILGADTATSRREIHKVEIESLQIVANDAARAIERSELYLRFLAERDFIKSIFTNITSGIITLDENKSITFLNPYSENVFKIQQNQALGKHYREVFGHLPSWLRVIDDFLQASKEKQSLEHHLVFPDAKAIFLETHFSKIRQNDQRHMIDLLFLRDITARKRMEEHIRRSDRLISVGVLAAGIAHEMRNPLTGISLLLDDLHDHIEDRGENREMIQRALQEIDRLENLISGLLDFADPSKPAQLAVRPLKDVFQHLFFLIKKQCKNQNIKLFEHLEQDLPEVKLDPERLLQALLNLLLNAIQAMPGGGEISIRVNNVDTEESMLSEPAIRIEVSDTGKGILPEDIPFIFDPFFSRNPTGHGLGLAIAHSIIQEHGGRISVFSEPGKGATFWIDLPIAARD